MARFLPHRSVEVTMSTTAWVIVILFALFLFGGGGYYVSRR
jgi:hypothetical protein